MIEAICYILRTGVPWRDLPKAVRSVEVGLHPLASLVPGGPVGTPVQEDRGSWFWLHPLNGYNLHQGACARGQSGRRPGGPGDGRTKGGLNTKLAMIVDALGRPVAMQLAPANRHDLKACAGLWSEQRSGWLVADRAFDSDKLRAALAAHGIFPCIPLKAGRRKTYNFSEKFYAHRHTVENANARLKRFRRIGTRYDKLAETFLGFVLLAASLDWINSEV